MLQLKPICGTSVPRFARSLTTQSAVDDRAESLATRIAAGDPQAERQLVSTYHAELMRVVRSRVQDPDDAQDIVQEVWLVALPKLRKGRIDTPAALGAFLRGIGRMLAMAHWRRAQRQRTDADSAIIERQEDAAPGPAEITAREQTRQLLEQIAVSLPRRRDREILLRGVLREECAAMLRKEFDLSSEHYYRVMSRARQRFLGAASAWSAML